MDCLSHFAIQRGWDRPGISDTISGEVGVVAMANIKKKTDPSQIKRTLGREEGGEGLEEAGYCVCAVCIIPPLLLGDLTTVLV